MPLSNYIKVMIGGVEVDITSAEKLPLSISYKLEDSEDFQKKSSATSFDVELPASLINQKHTNDLSNPAVEDMTTGELFKGFQQAIIEANGHELLVGKAKYTEGVHDTAPVSYKADFYGDNADWMIDLKETTFYDLLKTKSFPFTKAHMIDTWAFDGTDEDLFYVFAPVRYGNAMEDNDTNMVPQYMKASISKYWLLYWAFKSIGYRINSPFMDSPYFRRQLMPWTWGAFLQSDGSRLDSLDFLARSSNYNILSYKDADFTGFVDPDTINDYSSPGFDNNDVYQYDAGTFEMKWTYKAPFDYGTLDATFHMAVDVGYSFASADSRLRMKVYFYKNGVEEVVMDVFDLDAPLIGNSQFQGIVDLYPTIQVDPGDIITAKVWLHSNTTFLGSTQLSAYISAYELEYFRIPLGGTIDLEAYTELKKYKLLDMLRGVVDEFNLQPSTDSISKTVYFEPQHPYSVVDDQSAKTGGYFNGDFIDWNEKQDLLKKSIMKLYSDSERELVFKYKDDSNDGILKVVQERHQTTLGAGKYVLPDRFKAGKKEAVENRFFSPVMHYDVMQWKGLGTDPDEAPQMICLIPENISNTSKAEAQNTFQPKSVYYKGLVTDVGWIFDGEEQSSYPYMFAVNYKPGGEDDPVLSYSDEKIGITSPVVAKGLLRKFYLQRMAIMRNGQYYTTSLKLNNIDVANRLHREHKIVAGQRWELTEINQYKPLAEETTQCELRKWTPIDLRDSENVFPSAGVVLETDPPLTFDTKYVHLKCLTSDIKIPE